MTTPATLWDIHLKALAAFELQPSGATMIDASGAYRAYLTAKMTASAVESRRAAKRFSAVEP